MAPGYSPVAPLDREADLLWMELSPPEVPDAESLVDADPVAALVGERGAYAEEPKAPVPHRESGTLVVLHVEASPVVDGEGGDSAWARTPTFAPIASPCS